jgi:phage gp36-like protein
MYCSFSDLTGAISERTILQLCDDDNEAAFVFDNEPNKAGQRLLDAIASADTTIDSYIAERYDLPLNPVPDLIKQISVNLAICNLYERQREADLPQAISDRRASFIKTLEKLQSGKVSIPGLRKTAPESTFLVNKTDDDREFPDSLINLY